MPVSSTSKNYTKRNRVKLVYGGRDYFNLLEQLINDAQYSVHLQCYIVEDDEAGNLISKALIRAAQRNVKVYFIADGYASRNLSRAFVYNLHKAGVQFRLFEALFRSRYFYFGRRLHHKVAVIDARYALVGGVNIANRYYGFHEQLPWLDIALYAEGEVAIELYDICRLIWDKKLTTYRQESGYNKAFLSAIPLNEYCSARIRSNDWVKGKRQIWKTYFNFFRQARESITIMCSYFLPGTELRRQLSKAARRGVKVKIILAGPSDVMLAKNAERYLYQWMLRNNIEIYEYQPAILHAKVAVVDSHWVTAGSYNINNISAYASIELNMEVRNKRFATMVQNELDMIIQRDCIKVCAHNFETSFAYINRIVQKTCYEFIKVVLALFTFYFKQEE